MVSAQISSSYWCLLIVICHPFAFGVSFVKCSIYLFFLYIFSQVCRYFLEAVEKKQYGWFWNCPNGDKDCHYRHALPPGYVLKSQMKALLEEEANKIPIEEEIENQVIVILVLISFYIVSHLFKFIMASYW